MIAIAMIVRAVAGEDRLQHRGGYAVGRRVLNRRQRQHHQVGDVRQQIERRSRAVHPSASASGMLRLGSRTSPAMNVMSCQESAENSEPDCATHSATISPKTLPAATPSDGSKAPSAEHIA